MASEVIALLDKPGPRSMGAVPVALRLDHGGLIASGLKGSYRALSNEDLQDLVRSNQAIPVPEAVVPAGNNSLLAMWIGHEFTTLAETFQVPPPPIGPDHSFNVDVGQVWLGRSEEIYVRLVAWLERAFRRVLASSDNRLARLMINVMPDHELTRAAVWHTTPKTAREELLLWYERIDRDGNRAVDRESLALRFHSLCVSPPFGGVKVLLVSGKAGTRHREAALELTKRLTSRRRSAAMVSFGAYLRKQWLSEHGREATQRELQERGQELVDSTPFHFSRQVILQQPVSTEFLIVDGVRHHIISEALQFMFDSHTKSIGIEAPEPQVMQRLIQREGAEVVNTIMTDPTEREIPDLLKEANQIIPYDSSFLLDEDKLRQASELAVS